MRDIEACAEPRLDRHDDGGLARGQLLTVTEQMEGPCEMRHIQGAGLLELRVLLEIVVPVRQSDAALAGDPDHLGGILEILHLADAEHGIDADHLQLSHLPLQVRESSDAGDAVELGESAPTPTWSMSFSSMPLA